MVESIGTPVLYASFALLVALLLAVDFFLLKSQGSHRISVREAACWSVVWVMVAMSFGGWLWWYLDGTVGREVANAKALEYVTGYLIEKSLAVDNVFVWITLFTFFAVPPQYQKRVLLYGVLGAIVMRAIMIYAGALLLAQFHWILYVFGAFLLLTGVKMLFFASEEPDLNENRLLRWMRNHLRVTEGFEGDRFIVFRNGLWFATPLLMVLVLVEISDLIFAVDSVPAIFAVTSDPFIVFTSNLFAILGLRAMYFMLADVADRFHLLKYGLAAVVIFIGTKMLLLDIYKIPTGVALGVVFLVIAGSILASLLVPARRTDRRREDGRDGSEYRAGLPANPSP